MKTNWQTGLVPRNISFTQAKKPAKRKLSVTVPLEQATLNTPVTLESKGTDTGIKLWFLYTYFSNYKLFEFICAFHY